MSFPEFLKNERRRSGKSQTEVAEAVGIHHTYLSKIENGHTQAPSPRMLLKIADILDTSPPASFL